MTSLNITPALSLPLLSVTAPHERARVQSARVGSDLKSDQKPPIKQSQVRRHRRFKNALRSKRELAGLVEVSGRLSFLLIFFGLWSFVGCFSFQDSVKNRRLCACFSRSFNIIFVEICGKVGFWRLWWTLSFVVNRFCCFVCLVENGFDFEWREVESIEIDVLLQCFF